MVSLEGLVSKDHPYCRFKTLLNFAYVKESLRDLEFDRGAEGYGIVRLFSCLLLQFMEDLSDRELERY